jgi:glyoxylase-like metal-dependent hydrolase (beta-lactamase superfamily II)
MPVASATPGLVRIEARIGAAKPLFQHVVIGDAMWLWIDAGIDTTPAEALLGQLPWRSASRHVAVITHADVDHFGGLGQLRAAIPPLVVACHQRDARWIADTDAIMAERYLAHVASGIEVPPGRQAQLRQRAGAPIRPDVLLAGGETFDLGRAGQWVVVALPGHSPGSIGLWEATTRTAIVGDAVLGWGVVDGDGRLNPPPYSSVADYLATIATLEDLDTDRLLVAHDVERRGDEVRAFLAESRAAVHEIGAAVWAARGSGSSDLGALCDRVGRSLGRWPEETWPGLADAIVAHGQERVT